MCLEDYMRTLGEFLTIMEELLVSLSDNEACM